MFEYLFEKQVMTGPNIGIGDQVVDETRDITILTGVEPKCEDYYTEEECIAHPGCHWWGDACHSEPEFPPEEFPWWMILAAVGGAVVLIGLVFAFKGR